MSVFPDAFGSQQVFTEVTENISRVSMSVFHKPSLRLKSSHGYAHNLYERYVMLNVGRVSASKCSRVCVFLSEYRCEPNTIPIIPAVMELKKQVLGGGAGNGTYKEEWEEEGQRESVY